jgi:molecular chaperone GrpE
LKNKKNIYNIFVKLIIKKNKMSEKKDKQELDEEILEETEEQEVEEENTKDENVEEVIEEEISPEDEACMDRLAKTQADFLNFKARTEREKSDMIFFLKQDIFKKVLPVLDDLDRIITATLDENKNTPIYEGILSLYKKLN